MMTNAANDVLKAALDLSNGDRLKVVEALLASVPTPEGILREGDDRFFDTLEQRLAAIASGDDPGVDAFEALDQLEREFEREVGK